MSFLDTLSVDSQLSSQFHYRQYDTVLPVMKNEYFISVIMWLDQKVS